MKVKMTKAQVVAITRKVAQRIARGDVPSRGVSADQRATFEKLVSRRDSATGRFESNKRA
jgi:hypothetical protein